MFRSGMPCLMPSSAVPFQLLTAFSFASEPLVWNQLCLKFLLGQATKLGLLTSSATLTLVTPGNTQVFLWGIFLQFPKKSSPRFPPRMYNTEQELALYQHLLCAEMKNTASSSAETTSLDEQPVQIKPFIKPGLTKLARLKILFELQMPKQHQTGTINEEIVRNRELKTLNPYC